MPGAPQQQQQPSLADSGKWLRSYAKVSKWLQQYDLARLLAQHGGLCRIRNFLPPTVAEHAYQLVRRVPEHAWNATGAAEDYQQNNIDHFFWSTKQAASIQSLLRVFSILMPDKLHTFSAARYDASHHIAPHDDRAYTDVEMEGGQVVECSRTVAVIYYLTKDWRPEWGGHLVDLEGGATIVPEFNSLVAFVVPRYHEVTPVTGPNPRYSIFGWFLEPGRLYDLFTGDDEEREEAVQAVQSAERLPRQQAAAGGGSVPSASGLSGELPSAQQQQQLQLHREPGRGARQQQRNGTTAPEDMPATSTGRRSEPSSKRRRQAGTEAACDTHATQSTPSSSNGSGSSSRPGQQHTAAGAAAVGDGRGAREDERAVTLPVSRRGVLRLLHWLPYY